MASELEQAALQSKFVDTAFNSVPLAHVIDDVHDNANVLLINDDNIVCARSKHKVLVYALDRTSPTETNSAFAPPLATFAHASSSTDALTFRMDILHANEDVFNPAKTIDSFVIDVDTTSPTSDVDISSSLLCPSSISTLLQALALPHSLLTSLASRASANLSLKHMNVKIPAPASALFPPPDPTPIHPYSSASIDTTPFTDHSSQIFDPLNARMRAGYEPLFSRWWRNEPASSFLPPNGVFSLSAWSPRGLFPSPASSSLLTLGTSERGQALTLHGVSVDMRTNRARMPMLCNLRLGWMARVQSSYRAAMEFVVALDAAVDGMVEGKVKRALDGRMTDTHAGAGEDADMVAPMPAHVVMLDIHGRPVPAPNSSSSPFLSTSPTSSSLPAAHVLPSLAAALVSVLPSLPSLAALLAEATAVAWSPVFHLTHAASIAPRLTRTPVAILAVANAAGSVALWLLPACFAPQPQDTLMTPQRDHVDGSGLDSGSGTGSGMNMGTDAHVSSIFASPSAAITTPDVSLSLLASPAASLASVFARARATVPYHRILPPSHATAAAVKTVYGECEYMAPSATTHTQAPNGRGASTGMGTCKGTGANASGVSCLADAAWAAMAPFPVFLGCFRTHDAVAAGMTVCANTARHAQTKMAIGDMTTMSSIPMFMDPIAALIDTHTGIFSCESKNSELFQIPESAEVMEKVSSIVSTLSFNPDVQDHSLYSEDILHTESSRYSESAPYSEEYDPSLLPSPSLLLAIGTTHGQRAVVKLTFPILSSSLLSSTPNSSSSSSYLSLSRAHGAYMPIAVPVAADADFRAQLPSACSLANPPLSSPSSSPSTASPLPYLSAPATPVPSPLAPRLARPPTLASPPPRRSPHRAPITSLQWTPIDLAAAGAWQWKTLPRCTPCRECAVRRRGKGEVGVGNGDYGSACGCDVVCAHASVPAPVCYLLLATQDKYVYTSTLQPLLTHNAPSPHSLTLSLPSTAAPSPPYTPSPSCSSSSCPSLPCSAAPSSLCLSLFYSLTSASIIITRHARPITSIAVVHSRGQHNRWDSVAARCAAAFGGVANFGKASDFGYADISAATTRRVGDADGAACGGATSNNTQRSTTISTQRLKTHTTQHISSLQSVRVVATLLIGGGDGAASSAHVYVAAERNTTRYRYIAGVEEEVGSKSVCVESVGSQLGRTEGGSRDFAASGETGGKEEGEEEEIVEVEEEEVHARVLLGHPAYAHPAEVAADTRLRPTTTGGDDRNHLSVVESNLDHRDVAVVKTDDDGDDGGEDVSANTSTSIDTNSNTGAGPSSSDAQQPSVPGPSSVKPSVAEASPATVTTAATACGAAVYGVTLGSAFPSRWHCPRAHARPHTDRSQVTTGSILINGECRCAYVTEQQLLALPLSLSLPSSTTNATATSTLFAQHNTRPSSVSGSGSSTLGEPVCGPSDIELTHASIRHRQVFPLHLLLSADRLCVLSWRGSSRHEESDRLHGDWYAQDRLYTQVLSAEAKEETEEEEAVEMKSENQSRVKDEQAHDGGSHTTTTMSDTHITSTSTSASLTIPPSPGEAPIEVALPLLESAGQRRLLSVWLLRAEPLLDTAVGLVSFEGLDAHCIAAMRAMQCVDAVPEERLEQSQCRGGTQMSQPYAGAKTAPPVSTPASTSLASAAGLFDSALSRDLRSLKHHFARALSRLTQWVADRDTVAYLPLAVPRTVSEEVVATEAESTTYPCAPTRGQTQTDASGGPQAAQPSSRDVNGIYPTPWPQRPPCVPITITHTRRTRAHNTYTPNLASSGLAQQANIPQQHHDQQDQRQGLEDPQHMLAPISLAPRLSHSSLHRALNSLLAHALARYSHFLLHVTAERAARAGVGEADGGRGQDLGAKRGNSGRKRRSGNRRASAAHTLHTHTHVQTNTIHTRSSSAVSDNGSNTDGGGDEHVSSFLGFEYTSDEPLCYVDALLWSHVDGAGVNGSGSNSANITASTVCPPPSSSSAPPASLLHNALEEASLASVNKCVVLVFALALLESPLAAGLVLPQSVHWSVEDREAVAAYLTGATRTDAREGGSASTSSTSTSASIPAFASSCSGLPASLQALLVHTPALLTATQTLATAVRGAVTDATTLSAQSIASVSASVAAQRRSLALSRMVLAFTLSLCSQHTFTLYTAGQHEVPLQQTRKLNRRLRANDAQELQDVLRRGKAPASALADVFSAPLLESVLHIAPARNNANANTRNNTRSKSANGSGSGARNGSGTDAVDNIPGVRSMSARTGVPARAADVGDSSTYADNRDDTHILTLTIPTTPCTNTPIAPVTLTFSPATSSLLPFLSTHTITFAPASHTLILTPISSSTANSDALFTACTPAPLTLTAHTFPTHTPSTAALHTSLFTSLRAVIVALQTVTSAATDTLLLAQRLMSPLAMLSSSCSSTSSASASSSARAQTHPSQSRLSLLLLPSTPIAGSPLLPSPTLLLPSPIQPSITHTCASTSTSTSTSVAPAESSLQHLYTAVHTLHRSFTDIRCSRSLVTLLPSLEAADKVLLSLPATMALIQNTAVFTKTHDNNNKTRTTNLAPNPNTNTTTKGNSGSHASILHKYLHTQLPMLRARKLSPSHTHRDIDLVTKTEPNAATATVTAVEADTHAGLGVQAEAAPGGGGMAAVEAEADVQLEARVSALLRPETWYRVFGAGDDGLSTSSNTSTVTTRCDIGEGHRGNGDADDDNEELDLTIVPALMDDDDDSNNEDHNDNNDNADDNNDDSNGDLNTPTTTPSPSSFSCSPSYHPVAPNPLLLPRLVSSSVAPTITIFRVLSHTLLLPLLPLVYQVAHTSLHARTSGDTGLHTQYQHHKRLDQCRQQQQQQGAGADDLMTDALTTTASLPASPCSPTLSRDASTSSFTYTHAALALLGPRHLAMVTDTAFATELLHLARLCALLRRFVPVLSTLSVGSEDMCAPVTLASQLSRTRTIFTLLSPPALASLYARGFQGLSALAPIHRWARTRTLSPYVSLDGLYARIRTVHGAWEGTHVLVEKDTVGAALAVVDSAQAVLAALDASTLEYRFPTDGANGGALVQTQPRNDMSASGEGTQGAASSSSLPSSSSSTLPSAGACARTFTKIASGTPRNLQSGIPEQPFLIPSASEAINELATSIFPLNRYQYQCSCCRGVLMFTTPYAYEHTSTPLIPRGDVRVSHTYIEEIMRGDATCPHCLTRAL